MFNIGPGELFAIFALALIVLGPDRLPVALRTGGRIVGEVRRVTTRFHDELRSTLDDAAPPPTPDDDPVDDLDDRVDRVDRVGRADAADHHGGADGEDRVDPAA